MKIIMTMNTGCTAIRLPDKRFMNMLNSIIYQSIMAVMKVDLDLHFKI